MQYIAFIDFIRVEWVHLPGFSYLYSKNLLISKAGLCELVASQLKFPRKIIRQEVSFFKAPFTCMNVHGKRSRLFCVYSILGYRKFLNKPQTNKPSQKACGLIGDLGATSLVPREIIALLGAVLLPGDIDCSPGSVSFKNQVHASHHWAGLRFHVRQM